MEIYLVRHTTPDVASGICYGQTDLALARSFETERKALMAKIPHDNDTVVYSSPLQRCFKLAQNFTKNVHIDKRLIEMNFGSWEMVPWDAIPKKEIDPWMENFVNLSVPDGESYVELAARASEFFEELVQKKQSKCIVVSHSGIIRALIAQLTNTPLKNSFDVKIDYGNVSKITITDTTAVLVTL